ncbi:54S ribosomal protein [Teratosphaeria destructans]|uniref:54S ribosomal protein n=1 Tax=Teratosphaeria destructans TaxID=418781 RepID=A0A9W7SLU3_9PEZI|nr:54S ribosomal protein [Teratosphaeria destructans]
MLTQKCGQRQKPASRKRPRPQIDPTKPEEPSTQRRKRQRRTADESPLLPTRSGNLSEEGHHPMAYWAANQQWPRQYLEEGRDMENILARKRSVSARSRKNSDTGTATPSSTEEGESKSLEQKSAEYRKPQYAPVLATKGVSMKLSPSGVTKASREWCKNVLDQEQTYPLDTLFQDDLFSATIESIQDKNETRVIRDIALLIVPSAEVLAIRGATHLECLIDSVNEGWNNSIPITKTRPQPDYAVGFRREAFKQKQLDRMHPVVGDFNDQSYFMATWYMYFPFLTCEVKSGAAALDIADRQNAYSAAIAVRAVVELFRAVKREKELHREVLAFSLSHDHRSVRILAYLLFILVSALFTSTT